MSLLKAALKRAEKQLTQKPEEKHPDVDPLVVAMEDFNSATDPAVKAQALRAAIKLAQS